MSPRKPINIMWFFVAFAVVLTAAMITVLIVAGT